MRKNFTGIINIKIVIFILVLAKITIFLYLQPIFTPDSFGYENIANYLISSDTWFVSEHLDWDIRRSNSEPQTIFRIMGYPLLLVVAKTISPVNWSSYVVVLQGSLSLVATVYVYNLSKKISGSEAAALFSAFAHGTGQAFLLDQCILTDSLNATFLLIMLCHAGAGILDNRRPSLMEAFALGSLVFGAFLVREAGSYFQFLYWPLILFWGMRVMGRKVRGGILLVTFAVPMLVGVQAYKAWNQMRTGERFVTVGASTAIFFPTIYLEQRGVGALAADPLLGDMSTPLLETESTVRIIVSTIIPHLIEQHKFNMLQVSEYAMENLYGNWQRFPMEMALLTLSHLREKQAMLAFMPVETIDTAVLWATGESPFPRKGVWLHNLITDSRIDQFLMVAGRSISRFISIVILIAFVFGVPYYFFRKFPKAPLNVQTYDPVATLMLLYWLIYFGYTAVYAMIHLEVRYLMPVEPLSMVIGVALLTAMGKKYFPHVLFGKKT